MIMAIDTTNKWYTAFLSLIDIMVVLLYIIWLIRAAGVNELLNTHIAIVLINLVVCLGVALCHKKKRTVILGKGVSSDRQGFNIS